MPHIPQFSPPSSSSSRKSTAFSSSSFRNIFSSLRNSSSSSPSSSTWKKSSSSSSSLFQNPKRVSRYKRRLFLWIITLLLSCAFFYAFLSLGILTFFFPSAFSLTPQALLLDLTIGEVREFHSLLKGKPLPRHEDKTSIDASAVLVGPHGTVKAPYSRVIDHLLKIATLPLLTGEVEAYRTGDDFSIIIPVRNEEAYLPKTMRYLFDITPPERIREVIVVDDFSDTPIEQILRADLPSYMLHKTKFIRF
ncbi:polypeptide n-acetylgalactosaminyltransferase 12, partial [Cystoisospora suis]